MNSKHRRTLAAVFAEPVSPAIRWSDVEALSIAAGCLVSEGRGSRVRIVHGKNIPTFHRPHPGKEAKRYQIEDARTFLKLIGCVE